MSKLEDLVPPLELCKQIPEGAFAYSVLAWIDKPDWYKEPSVVIRDYAWAATSSKGVYPAPTLAEIFAQLPQTSTVTWFTQEEYPNNFAVCCYVLQPKPRKPKLKSEIDDNPAAAALKLWLELLESE